MGKFEKDTHKRTPNQAVEKGKEKLRSFADAVKSKTGAVMDKITTDKNGKKRKKLSKKWIIIIIILAVLIIGGIVFLVIRNNQQKKLSAMKETARTTATVTRGDISNDMTSSGSLAAKDTYTITSLVSGKILTADFEEGDEVKEGQVLYEIDSTDVQSSIATAEKSLESAQEDYEDAKKDYDEAEKMLSSRQITSIQTGYVKDLNVKKGDLLQSNGNIATLYNDSSMKLRVPFLNNEADALSVGQGVNVVLSDSGELIAGRIVAKSNLKETMDGGVVVKYVTIQVTNPGGLSTKDTASAYVGDIVAAGSGTFTAAVTESLRTDAPNGLRIDEVLVSEGQYIEEGTPLFTVTEDSASDALKTYKKSLNQAENSLESARERLDSLKEQLDEYTITAPIDGRVIYKNAKAGDKISTGSNNASTLAMIYDLSALTFEMSIDELDISKIKTGQEVIVTADAFEDETFYGTVTNVSLNGSYSSGVTTYPVVVTLEETGNLLPSMNVNGTIILEKSEDTLIIPSDALNRGNIVYVETTSIPADAEIETVENSNAPDGFTAVRVTTGLTSDDNVEILTGLTEGMTVYSKAASSENTMSFDMMGGFPGGDMSGGGMPSGGGNMPSGGGGGMPSGGGSSGGGRSSGGGGMPGGGGF